MAAGFKVGSIDLDDWFEPYQQGTKPALTGYRAGSQDLRDRYAPLVYGTKAGATNFKIASGADLNTLFAKKGSVAYALPADGKTVRIGEVLTNRQAGYAYAEFVADPNGTYIFQGVRSPNPTPGDTLVVSSGTWNTLGGSASSYQVRYTLSNVAYPHGSDMGTSTQNEATGFTALTAARAARIRADAATSFVGTLGITADLKIELRRAADGLVFSITNVHLDALVDGSV